MALNGSENKHCRGRIVTRSCSDMESVGRRQVIGTARFEQQDLAKKQKLGLLDSICLRELKLFLRHKL